MMRETIQLQEQLRKLHPSFDDCPAPCSKRYEEGERETDLPDFCEGCEVRTQLGFYEESARAELERRFPDGCEWTFETLSADVRRVRKLDQSVRGRGYPKRCTELEAQLLDILRSEEQRPTRIFYWQLAQKKDGEK
jgi:hypothetical protein